MNAVYKYLCVAFALLCGLTPADAKKQQAPRAYEVSLTPRYADVSQRYTNLDFGIRINVRSEVRENQIVNILELPSKEAASFPRVNFEYSLTQSAETYLDQYASALGLKVGGSPSTDFVLYVTIKDFRLRVRDYNVKKKTYSSSAAMVVSWELLDAQNKVVIGATTSTGRGKANSQLTICNPLAESFSAALSGIDWDRIASCLKMAKTARQEKNKEVTGMGDSALEHTVIRWYITSKPQGADVYWRVISSTPDVANTNSNFLGNTPYESTESFDIRGLTYNNSGNVQIEVTCEKAGYLPQRKRFNLRQAIDQKEISAKFNLVKEDEE